MLLVNPRKNYYCYFISKHNTILFRYETRFYHGNTTCPSCGAGTPFAVLPGSTINDFEVANGRIYHNNVNNLSIV